MELWPDTEVSFMVFEAMGSQWRVGPGGATGLDYGALPAVMDLLAVAQDQRRQVFADVRVMESEAISVMHKR